MKKDKLPYHLLALFTIVIWGSTFVSSKVLLEAFTPLQVMVLRFIIAYIALWIIKPHMPKLELKKELLYLGLGVFGCTVYFLAENTALTITYAANVSILVAAAPILTAMLAHFFTSEKLNKNHFYGFLVAMSGVVLVVFNGTFILKLNPIGDLLAFGAALCWAVYSVLLKKAVDDISSVVLTRKIMFYGLITALPALILEGAPIPISQLTASPYIFNILFLGIVASGICYATWNVATKKLGIVVTNNYIYINPFVTLVTAAVFLHEPISVMGVCGAVLIIGGVIIGSRTKDGK